MADLVSTIQRDIRSRLQELQPLVREVEQLEQALRALDGESRSTAPARAAAKAPKSAAQKSRRKRTPRGETRERILTYVREHPGSTAGEVATSLDLNRNSTGTRMTQLAKAGELKKAERGYEVGSA